MDVFCICPVNMSLAGSSQDPSLPSPVSSECAEGARDLEDDSGVQLPSDVESDQCNTGLRSHCKCKLLCCQQFDESAVEIARTEFLKDGHVRQGQVFLKVKGFVDQLPSDKAKIAWSIDGKMVRRPFWEFYHATGHKAIDEMVKLAKNGHNSVPERGARLPREKPKMDEADLWFLAVYQGLAEPTPMEDGGCHFEELADQAGQHEVIKDLNHPLLSLSLGISTEKNTVAKRFLNQTDVASLWHAYETEKAGEEKVSRDTFTKAFNRHWKRILIFKGEGQGVRCTLCAELDQSRLQCVSKKERQEIDLQKSMHLNRTDADRSVNVRGNKLSMQPSTYEAKNSQTAVMKILIDGMDQSKFRAPESLCNLQQHHTACAAHDGLHCNWTM